MALSLNVSKLTNLIQPLLAIWNNHLGVVLKAGLATPLRVGTLTAQRTSLGSVSQSTSSPKLQAAHGTKRRRIVPQVTRCVSLFPSSPTTLAPWHDAVFLSGHCFCITRQRLDPNYCGSNGSYRCRHWAFVPDHLSEHISPLVLRSALAFSKLCPTGRVNAHIIVYDVCIRSTQPLLCHPYTPLRFVMMQI